MICGWSGSVKRSSMKRSNICDERTVIMVSVKRGSDEAWERQSFKNPCAIA